MTRLEVMQDVTLTIPQESELDYYTQWEQDDIGMMMLGHVYQRNSEDIRKELITSTGWDRVKVIKVCGNPVGFVKHSPDVKNRNASICVYIIPEVRNTGILAVALYKFLDILFYVDSYHKAEFTAFRFNHASLNCFKNFHFDGVHREDKWYKGKYWDKHIYSLLEDEWEDCKKKYEPRFERLNEVYVRRYKTKLNKLYGGN